MSFPFIVRGSRPCLAAATAVMLLALTPPAEAQFVSNSSIQGTVTDQTGATLPGVTVTVSSSALQVAQLTDVTNAQGHYQLLQLPGGVYQIRYELSGFQTVVRENLQVAPGFAATIDIAMKIGAVAETITVSGVSPVVDVKTTSGSSTVTPEVLNKLIPGSRQFGDMAKIIPGLQSTSAPNIGRLGLGSAGGFTAYGESGVSLLIDGFEVRSNTYPDFGSAQAVDVKSFGNGADVQDSGSVWNLVSKSGGNQFHGRYAEQYIDDMFQSNNLDDKLRSQGLGFTDAVVKYSDLNSDLGGRIVRDKLWFYGNYRYRNNTRAVAGLALTPGPDGLYGTGDETPFLPPVSIRNYTGKLSYQPTPKYQLVAFRAADYQVSNGGGSSSKAANRFIPYEAATIEIFDVRNYHVEFRATLRDNLLFNNQFGNTGYTVSYLDTPSDHSHAELTAAWDRETGIFTGGSIGPGGNYAEAIRPTYTWVNQGNLTFLPKDFLGGGHEFKLGYRMQFLETHTDVPNHASGNYQLTFDRVGGLAHQPVEITTFNSPVTPKNNTEQYAVYLNDKWTVNRRLTANLGVRYDQDHAFLPEQTKTQGQFGNAGTFPAFSGNTFKNIAPRFGMAMDVTGDGKTVIKTTYSLYNGGAPSAANFNQNTVSSTVYRWHDLNKNNNYDPGEVDLSLNGVDFISTTAAANNIFNPDLKRAQQHEVAVAFDRELMGNMAGRFAWVYKQDFNLTATVNVLRPYSAYNIVLTRRDPGPDGNLNTADDGGLVKIYDYDAAYRGAAFVGNKTLNRPSDRTDHTNSFEFTLARRHTEKWGVTSSYTLTKNHKWITSIPASPNDDYFPINETWDSGFKINGSYRFPYGIGFSGGYDVQPGLQGQRTNIFRAADPDGGTPLRQLSTVTLRLEPLGSQRGPVRSTANLRLSKFQKLPKGELQFTVDALNAFNTNTFWAMTFASGPTFGYGTTFTSPRALQFGATYEF